MKPSNKNFNSLKGFFQRIKFPNSIDEIYDIFLNNLKVFVYLSFVFAVLYGIIRTLFYNGFNVDSYQLYALAIKDYILTGKMSWLFLNYYQRQRIVYPFIIAIVHIIYPMNISILASLINLVFSIFSIWLMRKIFYFYKFKEKEVDLFTIFVTLSYNFLNFNFNVIVDYVGLAFFLLFFYFLIKFKRDRKIIDFFYSFIFLLYAILAREQYVLAIFLYLFLINSLKIRISIVSGFLILVLILLFTIPDRIPFMDQFIAPLYFEVYLNKHYFKLFLLMQQKWITLDYIWNFIKGTIKVGILPTIVILTIFNWKKLSIKNLKDVINTQIKGDELVAWFIIFSIIYSTFYSNISSATGLRYWLPTSWILLIYLANNIIRNKIDVKLKSLINWLYKILQKKNITKITITKSLNFMIILFFMLYPISWSSVEWYINRESPTGTGSILKNSYSNSMDNIGTITKFDTKYIKMNEVNGCYLESILQEGAFEEDNFAHQRARLSFALWFEVKESIEIKVRLKTTNNAYWGLSLNEISKDYSPNVGEMKYHVQYLEAPSEFCSYYFKIHDQFHLRYLYLSIGGEVNSTILWDYLEVTIN